MIDVSIKYNVTGGSQPCALCGALTESKHGPDLFLEGTMQVICPECGQDHAPHLARLLELGQQAQCYTHACAR